ncbi:hypothetical protein [Halobacterium rubrum]|uniref:hypothetical protein n=1 Tax=Halobacterium TaxID=2239 RepID=UPI001F360A1B|nr:MULTISPECIES: hypothetical protein [Halobacterium]MDH5019673.1 hypothetical protein [Halobacterium rubrum]
MTAGPAVWTDDDESRADLDVILLRSCWDYHEPIDDSRDGQFVLMELELAEPYLWLGQADGAVEGLADAVEAAR